MNDVAEHRAKLAEVVSAPPAYPADDFAGEGIVVCAGGPVYLTCAYVCAARLRQLGCGLPLQIWHLGPKELPPHWAEAFAGLSVDFVDAHEVRRRAPARILNGWEVKPYALLHCPFRRVLLLDADNVPLADPTFLFEAQGLRETGALFWPDRGRIPRGHRIWEITGLPYRDEPEFESGQMLIDKGRCWHALRVTMHLNEHSDFYYRHVHGDKETFHLAWRLLDQPYWMAPPVRDVGMDAMYQHDAAGRRIFQHRGGPKWRAYGENPPVEDFRDEDACRAALLDLRQALAAAAKRASSAPGGAARTALAVSRHGHFWYSVGAHPPRRLELKADHEVGLGAMTMERRWDVVEGGGGRALVRLHGDEGLTAELSHNGDETFSGRWSARDLAEACLVPLPPAQSGAAEAAGASDIPLAGDVAVVSLCTPDFAGGLGEQLGRNKERYCAAHGYPFYFSATNLDPARPAAWGKLLLIGRHLPRHEWLFWTDADSVVMCGATRLEPFLLPDADLILTSDCNGINTGNFFIRRCPSNFRLLDRAYARADLTDHRWWEQEAIRQELLAMPDPPRVRLLPQRWFNSLTVGSPLNAYRPGDFIAHAAGTDKSALRGLLAQSDTPAPTCRDPIPATPPPGATAGVV